MTGNELKDFVQREAVKYWVEAGSKGTFELSTGTGKTIAALHCLTTRPRNDGKVHLFLAETNSREDDLNNDILLYEKLFNIKLRDFYNIVFKCYQGVYNLKGYDFGLIMADELHNGLTPVYSKFFKNNTYDSIVGLSATININTIYTIDGQDITKGELLDEIAPVCYRYTMKQSLDDGIGREINVYIIQQELNDKDATELSGPPKKQFKQTERAKYDYLDKRYKKSFFSLASNKDVLIQANYKWRSDMLYKLKSRINQARQLANCIQGKTIVFSNSLEAVLEVTPHTVSSKNTDEQNKTIRDNFDANKIKTIGSFKKLRQGANLKELDNVILMSYFGSETHIVQQIGRLRKNGDKVGNVFIFVAENTFEEPILTKILQYIPYKRLRVYKSINDVLNDLQERKIAENP